MDNKRVDLYLKTKAGRKALLKQYKNKTSPNLLTRIWNKILFRKIAD